MTDTSQYVTLGIDDEVFAVPVERVQEILDVRPVARLPHAPPYLMGMIDVRGRGVPVIDLRAKLGFPPSEETSSSRILVLEVTVGGHDLVLGLTADRVFEVTGLDGGVLEPPPEIGVRWRSDFITGVGRRGESFVIVFDLSRLFGVEDVPLLARPAAA
ncbi:chemotaxis protein CheW [Azospirillum sp. TSO22-1]|uniref:chemotaxis protein CheW n=1 Tax=Azospirillum sp. TSO22-1 TaxID=716789 RepID=UPI000D61B7D7|nr:chemotaxis protein CheW [Azospirillum sp. TSO22-1]PWC45779.1 chemotaxis protein CheW [Azospirillum sp. TSO22-1]